MIKRAWNWLLGIEGEKQPPPRLIDLVKQKDSSPDGGFARLYNNIDLFLIVVHGILAEQNSYRSSTLLAAKDFLQKFKNDTMSLTSLGR